MSNNARRFEISETGIKDFNDFIRDRLNLKQGDEIELVCDTNYITIVKSGRRCFICGSDSRIQTLGNGRYACDKCLRAISKSIDK